MTLESGGAPFDRDRVLWFRPSPQTEALTGRPAPLHHHPGPPPGPPGYPRLTRAPIGVPGSGPGVGMSGTSHIPLVPTSLGPAPPQRPSAPPPPPPPPSPRRTDGAVDKGHGIHVNNLGKDYNNHLTTVPCPYVYHSTRRRGGRVVKGDAAVIPGT